MHINDFVFACWKSFSILFVCLVVHKKSKLTFSYTELLFCNIVGFIALSFFYVRFVQFFAAKKKH